MAYQSPSREAVIDGAWPSASVLGDVRVIFQDPCPLCVEFPAVVPPELCDLADLLAIDQPVEKNDATFAVVEQRIAAEATPFAFLLPDLFVRANAWWGFAIDRCSADPFVKTYTSGSYYPRHIDMIGPGGVDMALKMSMTVQLSEPDYQGGDFRLWQDEDVHIAGRQRGTVLVFPAFVLHEVTPVTGVRKALTASAYGPRLT